MANPPTGGGDARTTTSNLAAGKRALVGAATAVRGQVSAGEDIWIEGQLEGELHAIAPQGTPIQNAMTSASGTRCFGIECRSARPV